MDFSVQYLSFFVIQADGQDQEAAKTYKHYQTLEQDEYENSEIKLFLDGEFTRISKRKAEVNAASESAPTKIGHFVIEPGHELSSNPNYNLFQRLRTAEDEKQFREYSDDMLRIYMETSAVRGGALIIASVKLNSYFDEPFVFVLKCDFEAKIARISEKSLISRVEMAISGRNIKSIQYPHMPEAGMLEERELKIHQASHARYFEDFLRFVSYEKSMPVIVNEQVMGLVQQYMEHKWQDHTEEKFIQEEQEPAEKQAEETQQEDGQPEESQLEERPLQERQPQERQQLRHFSGRHQEEQWLEAWPASEKRNLQERWTHDDVMQAASHIVDIQPDVEMKFKLDDIQVKSRLADYGSKLHIARLNGRYVVILEGDSFEFDKGISPIELLHPEELDHVLDRIKQNAAESTSEQ